MPVSMSKASGAVFVQVAIVLASALSLSAQDGLAGHLWPPRIAGIPFSADRFLETKSATVSGDVQTTRALVEHVYRDGEGRIRLERIEPQSGEPGRISGILISDVVTGDFYELDPQNKTVRRGKLTPRRNSAGRSPFNAAGGVRANIEKSSLGQRTISGLLANGEKVVTTMDLTDFHMTSEAETWNSPELKFDVITRTGRSTPSGSFESTRELVNIHQGEQDSMLFRPPQGYSEQ